MVFDDCNKEYMGRNIGDGTCYVTSMEKLINFYCY